ncbi:uncharacterized protein LOC130796638 [Actinidia eriantha]|uniref:uncharacterized protein LOC130796638 n=1 Tax=Actinidia eriantha TaxID=165200 RepID=UPI00258CD990|nr:uncharacterized protein LOC130796638 [Actinidia eriantha]
MTTEMIDNSGIAEMIAEMIQNEQNMNEAPLAVGANAGLAIPAALMAPVPTNIPFVKENTPVVSEGEINHEVITERDVWGHADFFCRNYVLNDLDNTLYNVYCAKQTAKELWKSLKKKYKTEDAGVKKFVVDRFLKYMMVDAKTVINQVQEFQVILHKIHAEGMQLSETFQVAVMIEKHPPSWKDFKNYLKHKRKEMNLKDLIIGHQVKDCRSRKNQGSDSKKPKHAQANMTVENISNRVNDMNLCAVVTEVNMIGSNTKEWWVDTGVIRHVCSNKKMFITYQVVTNGEQIFMGNSAISKVKGQGKVVLKMTSCHTSNLIRHN